MFMKWLTENSSRTNQGLRGTFVIIMVLSLLAVSGCALLPEEEKEEDIPTITAPKLSQKPEYTVTTETLETKVRGIGKVMSMKEETLFFPGSASSESSGSKRIKELYVRNGDFVEQGQLIAELDVVELQNQLRREKLSFRTEELQMIETLRKADEMTAIELETAKINFEQSRARLTELEEEIGRAAITAPFSGTITSISVQKGDQVQAYDTVAVLADLTQLTIAAEISKSDLQKIAIGMEAIVDINAAGQFNGVLSQLPIEKEDSNNNYDPYNPNQKSEQDSIDNYLLVDLEAFPAEVTIGTPLSVSIIVNRKENVVVIPLSALRSHGGRDYVQVVDEEGKREVDVEVGQKASTVVEIIKGLEPGQKVVGR
jgi:macrolide-specific efflux system membrane fusion protein